MSYEIQHRTWADGWVNTSTTEDVDGNKAPLVFDTHTEAQVEMDDHMREIDRQIASGERSENERYDRSEFRIREVKENQMSKQAQRLAEEFAETIRKDLTETELLTVNERNDKRNDVKQELSCATHDFIDSNESMLTAMESLNIKVDLDSDKQIALINEAWQIAQESNFALSKWNPGDQANPAVMCEMCQAIDTPIGGDYIMTVSEEECKWIDRKNHKENQ